MRRWTVLALLVLLSLVAVLYRRQSSHRAYDLRAAAPKDEANQSFATGQVAAAAADLTLAPASLPSADGAFRLPADAMLVRSGTASIEADSLAAALDLARALATRLGGFVAGTDAVAGRGPHRMATLELRVPAERFDDLVRGLDELGRLEHVQVSTEDVGEEYTDVAARVANGKRLEARLLDLLATRTGKLQDVMTVEQELARVREGIERYEARLRYLQARTAMSRLSLSLHEPVPVLGDTGPSPLKDAARQAWRNFIELLAAAVASLGVVVPLGSLAWGAWWLWRRRRPALY